MSLGQSFPGSPASRVRPSACLMSAPARHGVHDLTGSCDRGASAVAGHASIERTIQIAAGQPSTDAGSRYDSTKPWAR